MDARSEAVAALRAAAATDPDHASDHRITLALLDRAGPVVAEVPGWEVFPEAAAELVDTEGWPLTVAVMANLFGVVALDAPVDYVAASDLVVRHGHRQVAAVRTTIDGLLGAGPRMPLATRYARAMADRSTVVERLAAAGIGADELSDRTEQCVQSAFWLVAADVAPDEPMVEFTSAAEAVRFLETGGLPAWRAQLAVMTENPWSPYAARVVRMLTEQGWEIQAQGLEQMIEFYREQSEDKDRKLVAREIRQLVAMSGLTQREFASLSGTSAPRLSTYVNGLVTPSASMMVRFRRVSERARAEAARTRGSSA